MNLFGGIIDINGIVFQLFAVFAVILAGYLIGRIEIMGVSLGTAGIFIAALIFGAVFGADIHSNLTLNGDDITSNAFKIIETTGLILFIGSAGMIAGPNFFGNLKRNYKAYIFLGVIITAGGALAAVGCYFAGIGHVQVPQDIAALGVTDKQYMISMIVGIMSGALTSTPAYSAAKATAASVVPLAASDSIQDVLTIGHAIAYSFGVIGVVLFVQLMPRLLKADMELERKHISTVGSGQGNDNDPKKGSFSIDKYGFGAFGFVAVAGIVIGAIKVPLSAQGLSGTTFSLTTTGGVLISGLVCSYFGHLGPVSLKVEGRVLEVFREFGLVFFLIGSGIPGGASFVKYFHPVYFMYGMIITIVPMFIGYFAAKKLFKLPLLNSLGSITGGMTSTPALGTLIKTAGTDDVASSYAATYPIALLCVVLASQVLILIFGT